MASFLDPHGTAFICVGGDEWNRAKIASEIDKNLRKAYVFVLKTTPSSSLAWKSFKHCRDEYLTRYGTLTFYTGPLTGIILYSNCDLIFLTIVKTLIRIYG
jgi:hypothetical protein